MATDLHVGGGAGSGRRAGSAVRTLGEGAEWIGTRAGALCGLPGVEVFEVLDIGHARQHVWKVGGALVG